MEMAVMDESSNFYAEGVAREAAFVTLVWFLLRSEDLAQAIARIPERLHGTLTG
jgi:hypothetical protein